VSLVECSYKLRTRVKLWAREFDFFPEKQNEQPQQKGDHNRWTLLLWDSNGPSDPNLNLRWCRFVWIRMARNRGVFTFLWIQASVLRQACAPFLPEWCCLFSGKSNLSHCIVLGSSLWLGSDFLTNEQLVWNQGYQILTKPIVWMIWSPAGCKGSYSTHGNQIRGTQPRNSSSLHKLVFSSSSCTKQAVLQETKPSASN